MSTLSESGPQRAWEPSPWSDRPAAYVVALVLWAALGMVYLPILSMILAPVWMVFFVSVLPRWIARLRRRAARGGVQA
ncbi:MAG: hypothetical protein ACT4PP_10830 [Sporichthyaceae bacterium]